MPKVSIIVPVYNTETYLPKCLDSLVNQTLKEVEIICVNDGSTDNSLDLLNQYAQKDKRIKIINFKENKGAAFARNVGIETATGEYIGFVDSDDFVDLDFYEKLYTKAMGTGKGLIIGNIRYYLWDKNLFRASDFLQKLKQNKLYFNVNFTTALYKKTLLGDVIKFTESSSYGEDRELPLKAVLTAGSLAMVEDVYYTYVQRSTSAINTVFTFQKAQSLILAWKHIFHFLEEYKLNSKDYSFLVNLLLTEYCDTLFNKTKPILELMTDNYVEIYEAIDSSKFNDSHFAKIYQFAKNKQYNDLKKYYTAYTLNPMFAKLRGRVLSRQSALDIPIVVSSDDKYCPHITTLVSSVCKNTSAICNFYVLDGGISPENKNRIKLFCQQFNNCVLNFYPISQTIFSDFGVNSHVSIATYYRFLIADMFPFLTKALYLDLDMIVRGDISSLYQIDLGNFVLAAVPDQSDKDYIAMLKHNMELDKLATYFNAGVLLINLQKWRENRITEQLFDIEKKYHNFLLCNDQDILNKYFMNNYLELDKKFNLMFGSEADCIIRHFVALPKPWELAPKLCVEKYADFKIFWDQAMSSPFYNELCEKCPYKDTMHLRVLKMIEKIKTKQQGVDKEGLSAIQGIEMDKSISIIIPVYNVQKHLKKCLESVCNQTYKNLEIICVDDCSTDNSLNILKEYAQKDQRIKIIQRSGNGGQAAARQTGIDEAFGDYIGFVDSDDWIDPDYYKKMLERALQDKADITVNGNISVHEGEKVYDKNFPGHKQLEQKIYENPLTVMDKFYCVVWNKLFRTDFLKKKKYTISNRNAHEDVFFHYTTFALAKTVSFFYGPAYHYLARETSVSKAGHDWGVEHIKVYSQIYDFYRDNDLLNKKIKLYSTMPFFIIKNEEMFNEYRKYFTKIANYLDQNKDIFNALDLFFAQSILECKDYTEYISKYSGAPLTNFLRRKK